MKTKKITAVFLFMLGSLQMRGDTTLVSYGSTWKYFDLGTLPALQWQDSSYLDSAWPTGNAEFGYGDGDESTLVSYGNDAANKYVTTYFRKQFILSNSSQYTSVQLNIKRDDGAVVYVNGVEVFRSNMPVGLIADTTLASTFASDDGTLPQTVLLPVSAFVDGSNVIAVEVHQSDVTSTDLSFDLELSALVFYIPYLTRQPYLQMVAPDAITLKWRTDIATFSKVCYGATPDSLSDCLMDSLATLDHEVRLTGLNAATQYYYSISDGAHVLQGDSANYFITSPMAGVDSPVRFWILSDAGVNSATENNVRDAFLSYNNHQPVSFMLLLGDNAYNLGTDQEYQDAFFQNHYEEVLKNLPVYSTAGNHENYSSDALTQTGPYYDIFTLPSNGEVGGVPSGSEAYYSFDYGTIHFICLESNTPSLRLPGSDMLNWLQNDLATTHQKWKVVYFHNPPYTKGGHNSDGESDLVEIRQNIVPILEQYKTDLVLNGHSHVYERSYQLNGHYGLSTTLDSNMVIDTSLGMLPNPLWKQTSNNYSGTIYVQAGVSGVVEAVRPDWPHPAMRVVDNVNAGSLMVAVEADTLTLKFIDSDVLSPHVLDEFSIVKKCNVIPTMQPVTNMCQTSAPVVLSAMPSGGVFSGNGVVDSLFYPNVAGGGNHSLTYTYTDDFACHVSTSIQVEVVPGVPGIPSVISGPSLVCPPVNNLSLSIALQQDADTYQWSIAPGSNGITLMPPKTDTVVFFTIYAINPSYTINVTASNICGSSIPQSITMNSVKNLTIIPFGSSLACPLDTLVYTTFGLNALATLSWSAPVGSIINGQNSPVTTTALTAVPIIFPPGFSSGNVCVASHPSCLLNTRVHCISVSAAPSQPGYIQGPGGVLPGATGSVFGISPVVNASGYIWTLPSNATLVSGQNTNSITVDFSSAYTGGPLAVKALSECGESVPSSRWVRALSMFSGSVLLSEARAGSDTNDSYTNVEKVAVFPNPVDDVLNIRFPLEMKDSSVEIVLSDVRGKRVCQYTYESGIQNFSERIFVKGLAKGVYFLKITSPIHQYYERIIKQ